MHVENLWENTYCSSQFKNGEVCSRIDGSHIKKFIMRCNGLVDVIKSACMSNSYIKNFTELLNLSPSLYAFWTEVTIESYDSYIQEIDACVNNADLFYKHGRMQFLRTLMLVIEKPSICIAQSMMCLELLETL